MNIKKIISMNEKAYFDFLLFSLDDTMSLNKDMESINWKDLYRFAKKQSLVGIYFRGIQRLPQRVFADFDLLAEWTNEAQKIQQKNKDITIETSKLSSFYTERGYRVFILNGQGNALMYPEPWLHNPDDIKIFVKGWYDFPSFLLNPIHHHRLRKWFDNNTDLQCSNKVTVNVDEKECTFSVPTTAFNIIYQLLHMENLVMQSGFCLSQLFDYYQLLMTADVETVQSPAIQTTLKEFGLAKFAGAIMWVLQAALALPDERIISQPYPDFGRMILDDILDGRVFGRYLRLCWYYPSEALFKPFSMFHHSF